MSEQHDSAYGGLNEALRLRRFSQWPGETSKTFVYTVEGRRRYDEVAARHVEVSYPDCVAQGCPDHPFVL